MQQPQQPNQQQQKQPGINQAQQTAGKSPPSQLTTKDLAYLEDQMSWLLVASKKCNAYAGDCSDMQVKTMLNQICQTHERQYQSILQCCQSHAQMSIQAQAGLH